jgi:hypothetical protein
MTARPLVTEPAIAYRNRTIYLSVVGLPGEFNPTPVICEQGEPPHRATARRLRLEEIFPTRAEAETAGYHAARAWIDRGLDDEE